MGTTSEKLTYLNETKQELKDKINNLGGSIDEHTTFRQYANQLQNVYDNLPKTEYQEGTEVNLGVTSKGKLDFDNGVVGIGQSSQESTTGINLIDMVGGTNGNYNDKGIKITDNGDGTITINGTLTSNATVAKVSKLMNITLTSGQVYTLWVEQVSGSVEGGNFSKVIFQDATQLGGVSGNTSQVYQYTPAQDYENNINFGIYTSSGRIFNNLKLRVMLVKGSYTYSQLTYEPYSDGYQSPSPNWQQPIQCVTGEQSIVESGKNLINLENSEVGGIDTSGNLVVNNNNWRGTEYIPVKPNTQYTISSAGYGETAYILRLYQYDTNKTFISPRSQGDNNSSLTITTGATTKYLKWTLFLNATVITSDIIASTKPMICKGTDTTYEPYHNPTTYTINLGKNIYETPQSFVQSNFICNCYVGETYTFSFKGKSSTANARIFFRSYNGTYTQSIDSYIDQQVVFMSTSEASYSMTLTCTTNGFLYFRFANGSGAYTVSELQVERGSQATTYAPYFTPLEFHGIGTYKDELVTDRSTGKWYKLGKIKKLTMNGNEEGWQYSNGTLINTKIEDYFKTIDNLLTCYLNYYKSVAQVGSASYLTNNYTATFGNNASNYRLYIKDTNFSSINPYKEWLSTHNLIVCYVLETPTLTEITDTTLITQLEAWYNAQSINGTTIITSNGNLPMIIKVRGLKGE